MSRKADAVEALLVACPVEEVVGFTVGPVVGGEGKVVGIAVPREVDEGKIVGTAADPREVYLEGEVVGLAEGRNIGRKQRTQNENRRNKMR